MGRLCAQWLALLSVRGKRAREDHGAEIAGEVAELLRLGWTAEQLRASIADPARPRWEWPREWRARVLAQGRQPARTLPTPAEVAAKAEEVAAKAKADREDLQQALGGDKPSELFRRRRGAQ